MSVIGVNLSDCKEIASVGYMDLKDPKFRGQTPCDENDNYWMAWESEGVLYKIQHNLFGKLVGKSLEEYNALKDSEESLTK